MLSTYGDVMSVRGEFVHENTGSKRSGLAPSASKPVSSPRTGIVVDKIECLYIDPSRDPNTENQSVSNPYVPKLSTSMLIDGVG